MTGRSLIYPLGGDESCAEKLDGCFLLLLSVARPREPSMKEGRQWRRTEKTKKDNPFSFARINKDITETKNQLKGNCGDLLAEN